MQTPEQIPHADAFLNTVWHCAMAPLTWPTRAPLPQGCLGAPAFLVVGGLGGVTSFALAIPAAVVTGGYALARWALLRSRVKFSTCDLQWTHTRTVA
jgi:hypothetical protein